MLSSISNFDGRRWHVFAAASLILAAMMLVGWNQLALSHGFEPTIEDDLSLWLLSWDRIQKPDSSMTVFIGSSRTQYALSPRVWKETTGKPAAQLSIVGSNSVFMLEELARREAFRGVVIGDLFSPLFSYADFADHGREPIAFVKEYDRRSAVALIERRLRLFLEQRFAFWHDAFAIDRVVRHVVATGDVPIFDAGATIRGATVTMPDRFKWLRTDVAKHESSTGRSAAPPRGVAFNWNGEHPDPAILDANLRRINHSVRSIQRRGGRVVFLRMPLSGIHSDLELQNGNGDEVWRRIASETGATVVDPMIAAELYSGLTAADGVHLAGNDAIEFTRRLAALLPKFVFATQSSAAAP